MKIILKKILFVFMLIGSAYLPKASYAQELIVAIDDFPPWNITTSEPISGINVDILTELSQRLDLQLSFIKCPWKRCLKMMRSGQVDIIPGLLKRAEREEYMEYINPPYKEESTKAFYVHRGKEQLISKYQDLYKLNVGVVAGNKYYLPYDEDQKIIKQAANSELQQLRMLEKRRVHTFVGTASQIDYLIIAEGLQHKFVKADYKYNEKINVHLAVSKKSKFANEISQFDAQIQKMKAEGVIDKIITDFYKNIQK